MRKITIEKAKKEIIKLFQKNKKLYYSDMSGLLNLDYSQIFEACEQLKKEGLIEEAK